MIQAAAQLLGVGVGASEQRSGQADGMANGDLSKAQPAKAPEAQWTIEQLAQELHKEREEKEAVARRLARFERFYKGLNENLDRLREELRAKDARIAELLAELARLQSGGPSGPVQELATKELHIQELKTQVQALGEQRTAEAEERGSAELRLAGDLADRDAQIKQLRKELMEIKGLIETTSAWLVVPADEGAGLEVSGSFDHWASRRPMTLDGAQWRVEIGGLETGHRYWFKFRDAGGNWFVSHAYPEQTNVFGTRDNFTDV